MASIHDGVVPTLLACYPHVAMRRAECSEGVLFGDENLPREYSYDHVPEQVLRFFVDGSKLVYPAKSFFVAIVYAVALQKHFGIDAREALSFEDLLPNDPCFRPWDERSAGTYLAVLGPCGDISNELLDLKSTQSTYGYFKKEFGIEP